MFVAAAIAALPAQGWPLPPTKTGNLYVSGYSSNNVGEFRKDGSLVRTFTHATMSNPRGLAVEDDGTIVVVVQTNARILRMSPDGALLQTITHPDLTSGTGISRSPSGSWYVGNFNPGRVLVFDANWGHVTTVTQAGMNGVNCVSFDSSGSGDFAVTSAIGNTVNRFDANHVPVGTVTHPNMASPMSIADDSSGAHYVSQGSSGRVIKFDAAWNPVATIGLGTLAAPQGIAVDESDVLTISNFSSNLVHRYDTAGNLLGSFALSGVTIGRNMAWQTSAMMLARQGVVGTGAAADPEAVLSVSGQTGDGMHRVHLAVSDPFDITLQAPSSGPAAPVFVLYAHLGEPGVADVVELPAGIGPMAFAPPFAGGTVVTLANNVGLENLLGTGVIPALPAPTTILSLPLGLGFPIVVTLQGVVMDVGSATGVSMPFSTTNAVVVVVS